MAEIQEHKAEVLVRRKFTRYERKYVTVTVQAVDRDDVAEQMALEQAQAKAEADPAGWELEREGDVFLDGELDWISPGTI